MLIFLFIVIFIYFITPSRVTPKGYYHISKVGRQHMINNLQNDCHSEDTIYLIATYLEVFKGSGDANATII